MLKKIFSVISLSFLACLFLSVAVQSAPPIKDVAYSGKYVSQTVKDPIVIGVGETKEVAVKIKNTGSKIWNATGELCIGLYG